MDPVPVPPDPKPTQDQTNSKQTTTTQPKVDTPRQTSSDGPVITKTTNTTGPIIIGGSGDLTGGGVGPISLPPEIPGFDPIEAMPSGNPGNWITNNDYRTSWINRGLEGVAGFSLNIDANGRVTNCSITSSTGHSLLDDATCRLLQRRARFEPARDSSGNAVSGSYNSSVRWSIPE